MLHAHTTAGMQVGGSVDVYMSSTDTHPGPFAWSQKHQGIVGASVLLISPPAQGMTVNIPHLILLSGGLAV